MKKKHNNNILLTWLPAKQETTFSYTRFPYQCIKPPTKFTYKWNKKGVITNNKTDIKILCKC